MAQNATGPQVATAQLSFEGTTTISAGVSGSSCRSTGGHAHALATSRNQGYVVANQNYVLFPTIGVNAAGKGVISFTLVGPDFFPSAAFATLGVVNGAGDVQIAALGALPDDGFTGYSAFNGARVGRWGDYGAGVAHESGNIWLATEYIPNSPRTVFANWGTFVTNVIP